MLESPKTTFAIQKAKILCKTGLRIHVFLLKVHFKSEFFFRMAAWSQWVCPRGEGGAELVDGVEGEMSGSGMTL